jgi:hypothetical protein
MSLREEIAKILAFETNSYAIQNDTDKILKAIEKRIDSIMQREITDSHHFEIQQMKNDLNTTDAVVRICREIKGLLNES